MPANEPAAYDAMSTEKMSGSLSDQLDAVVQSAMDMEFQEETPEADLPEDMSATLEDEAEPTVAANAEGAVAEVMASSPASPQDFINGLRSAGYEIVQTGGGSVPESAEMPVVPDDMTTREATRVAAERALGGGMA